MSYFEKATPEAVGIASEGIVSFIKDVEKKGIELHSLMVIRHGKCAAAGWWKPYGPEFLHPLYSFSKSLTATAIGFAEQEGILSLDERLADIFTEEMPEQPSEYLKEVTLHHLLIMGCGQETEIGEYRPTWIRDFLNHPFLHKPGTFYKYNTAGTNMLAAVLKKKTGQDVTEFLRPRLLEPLGISRINCVHIPGPDAVELGGGGMQLTTEDMAKFTYFMAQKGKWEGRQLLRESWFERACSKQIETAGDSEGHVKEWANGYGYQCWMGSLPGSFRADGAYGQFGLVYPGLDLEVVMTSATEQTQSLLDSLMEYLIPAVREEVLPPSPMAKLLEQTKADLRLPVCHNISNPTMEEKLKGRIFSCDSGKICSSLERLTAGAGLFIVEEEPITQMEFSFENGILVWNVSEGAVKKTILASMEGDFCCSMAGGKQYAASACWRSIHSLELEVRRMDALSGVRLIFRFQGDKLIIEADDTLISVGGLGIFEREIPAFFQEK